MPWFVRGGRRARGGKKGRGSYPTIRVEGERRNITKGGSERHGDTNGLERKFDDIVETARGPATQRRLSLAETTPGGDSREEADWIEWQRSGRVQMMEKRDATTDVEEGSDRPASGAKTGCRQGSFRALTGALALALAEALVLVRCRQSSGSSFVQDSQFP
ncbi:MAG: hypothetical protein M4579_001022 [Chaenotheca gracillima]|nr:MAG: hypothetical protein M4579_001022 [Chaenotheca gracillima]